MKLLQILGTGCPKCNKLAQVTEQAAKELDIDYKIEKITDINEMLKFGMMATPALVVDGQVKTAGKVPSVKDIVEMIR